MSSPSFLVPVRMDPFTTGRFSRHPNSSAKSPAEKIGATVGSAAPRHGNPGGSESKEGRKLHNFGLIEISSCFG